MTLICASIVCIWLSLMFLFCSCSPLLPDEYLASSENLETTNSSSSTASSIDTGDSTFVATVQVAIVKALYSNINIVDLTLSVLHSNCPLNININETSVDINTSNCTNVTEYMFLFHSFSSSFLLFFLHFHISVRIPDLIPTLELISPLMQSSNCSSLTGNLTATIGPFV